MNILLALGPVFPKCNTNANLIRKLIPLLRPEHTLQILSLVPSETESSLPKTLDGVRVHWVTDESLDPVRRFVYPAVCRITDPKGYSDALLSMLIRRKLRRLLCAEQFDLILTTMEPFPMAHAVAVTPASCQKILYLMDPPACTYDPGAMTCFRTRTLKQILSGYHSILTTPFIHNALVRKGMGTLSEHMELVGFPLLEPLRIVPAQDDISMDPQKINLLFCGWLHEDIRSPQYFLKLMEGLDEQFCVYFVGRECDRLRERYPIQTRAQVITLGQVSYQAAINAMCAADVLVNIGNSVGVHLPSKTLEYCNTQKPIVNLHKLTDCPTLEFMKHYPLTLNLFEGDPDPIRDSAELVRFCTANKGMHTDIDCRTLFPEFTGTHIVTVLNRHLHK